MLAELSKKYGQPESLVRLGLQLVLLVDLLDQIDEVLLLKGSSEKEFVVVKMHGEVLAQVVQVTENLKLVPIEDDRVHDSMKDVFGESLQQMKFVGEVLVAFEVGLFHPHLIFGL